MRLKKFLLIGPGNKTLCPIFARSIRHALKITRRLLDEHYTRQPSGRYTLLQRNHPLHRHFPSYSLTLLWVHRPWDRPQPTGYHPKGRPYSGIPTP